MQPSSARASVTSSEGYGPSSSRASRTQHEDSFGGGTQLHIDHTSSIRMHLPALQYHLLNEASARLSCALLYPYARHASRQQYALLPADRPNLMGHVMVCMLLVTARLDGGHHACVLHSRFKIASALALRPKSGTDSKSGTCFNAVIIKLVNVTLQIPGKDIRRRNLTSTVPEVGAAAAGASPHRALQGPFVRSVLVRCIS